LVESDVAGALDGIRVLDFSRTFAGPAATQILGDLGADVIKVEEPLRGDESRYFGATKEELAAFGGTSPSYLALNRNKRSIALDLASEAGQKVALRLASKCDVLAHNFRVGSLTKWGLGYDAVKAINPGIIYTEFSAFGIDGPMAHFGANDLALQGHSGMLSITGEPGREPVRCGTAVVDLSASLSMVSGILAALFHRQRTGEGQLVETSLLLASAHLMNYIYTDFSMKGELRGPMGTGNHLSVPNQAFPARDGHVIIISPSDEMWARCAKALDAEKLDLPQYRVSADRLRLRDELIPLISDVTRKMPSREIVDKLSAVKVNVSKVNNVGEALNHEQLAAAGGVMTFPHDGKTVQTVATPFKLSKTPTKLNRPPPTVGGDAEQILSDFGFRADEVSALGAQGAFGKQAALKSA
jgi:crotonobetainyl-CoA:carnitine CoA-transferase CaiB-like acyl-CoA transferase